MKVWLKEEESKQRSIKGMADMHKGALKKKVNDLLEALEGLMRYKAVMSDEAIRKALDARLKLEG